VLLCISLGERTKANENPVGAETRKGGISRFPPESEEYGEQTQGR